MRSKVMSKNSFIIRNFFTVCQSLYFDGFSQCLTDYFFISCANSWLPNYKIKIMETFTHLQENIAS